MISFSKLKSIEPKRVMASLILIIMSTQYVLIEGYTVSYLKVAMMALCLGILIFKGFYLSKAVKFGLLYWLTCFVASAVHSDMRFSTLGYLALFLVAYMLYYQYIYSGTLSFVQFKALIRGLIYAYFIALAVQQFFVILGLKDMPILNLGILSIDGLPLYYEWNRLPSLSCEPSHSAVILTGLMIGYIRCLEIEAGGKKISVSTMFSPQNRYVILAFLYLVLFMGSGTAWIGLGIVTIYFIRRNNLIYMLPLCIVGFAFLLLTGNEQLKRAISATTATLTMDVEEIQKADLSAAQRIVPLVNTLTADLTDKETWFGKGTAEKSENEEDWIKVFQHKISPVEQYGLVSLIAIFIFVYTCIIFKFWSIETLCFVILSTCAIGNVYMNWSMLYVFTAVKYFREVLLPNQGKVVRKRKLRFRFKAAKAESESPQQIIE